MIILLTECLIPRNVGLTAIFNGYTSVLFRFNVPEPFLANGRVPLKSTHFRNVFYVQVFTELKIPSVYCL